MGIWLPRGSNVGLVREVRAMWRRAQALRGRHAVRIEHVRSHTAVPGNELADKLADAGRLLDGAARDIEVDKARGVMSTIALATNVRDQRRPRAATPPYQPPITPNQPFTALRPFTIYQTSQTPANAAIRDWGG